VLSYKDGLGLQNKQCINIKSIAMKIKNNIAVSDNGFVFNPASGESFTVNQVGLDILNMLRKGEKQETIVQQLSEKYQADTAVIERDFSDFQAMVKQYHLHQNEE